jgi:hypothetical protein
MRTVLAATLLGWATLAFGQRPGVLIGTLDRPAGVTCVAAMNREAMQAVTGSWDGASGAFAVSNLAVGVDYDLRIDFEGARLEGVNLHVPPAEDPERTTLTTDDVAEIRAKILNMNQFEDRVEIMSLTGNGEHAAILMNKLRTKPFWNSRPGEVIWRVELWHYQRPEDHWLKVQDELFIIFYRERMPSIDLYNRKAIVFDPQLGGLRPEADTPMVQVGTVALPAAEPGIRLREAPGGDAGGRKP